MMKLRNILASALVGLPLLALGQSRSLPILEINPDARATAMGGNQYGEASTMSIYANPTTLLYENMNWEVSAATQIYPKADEDIGRLMFYGVSAGKRFGNHGVLVGFRYLGGYDIPADEGKSLKPADWTVDANYSIRFLDHFSATAGVSLVHSKVMEEATTVAFNAAAYYRNGFETGVSGNYVIGINVAGLGPKLDYGARYRKAKLPAHYGGGGELGLDFNEQHRLSVSLAAQHYCYPQNASMFTGNVGAEYTFLGIVSVRGGYTYAEHDYSRYSFGAGISFGNIRFNVAHQRGLGDNEVTQTMLSLGLLL